MTKRSNNGVTNVKTNVNDEITLKPCPFCGGEATTRIDYSSEIGELWAIDCLNLDCKMADWQHVNGANVSTGWRNTEAEAVEAWNTRAENNDSFNKLTSTLSLLV